MDRAVAVEGVSKRFGEVVAVDDLSFELAPGHVCGLLGPNGAGKTTTVRMILGLVRPDAGTTAVLGEDIRPGASVLGRVGVLVERPAFVPHVSGMANLRLFWRAGRGSWPPPALDYALDLADLGAAVGRRVKTYSQGMRQRLGIAQALMGRPDVLVLDEPTNGLDPGEMRDVRHMLKSFAESGISVLLSSHLLSEVEQVCGDVVVMDRGRLITAGTVADIIASAQAAYIEVDDVDAALRVLSEIDGVRDVRRDPPGISASLDSVARAALVARLVDAGIAVETVTARNRLEDAFLSMLGDER